jgi:hypothetical protein
MQLRIPFLFTSLVLQKKLVGRSAESRLPLAIRARMAPPVAPAIMLLVSGIDIGFTRYWNVTRAVGRRIYVPRNAATRVEIFVDGQNQIRFHNCSFHVVRI